MIPVLLVGLGLWGNWYSSKALDEVSSVERLRRPLSDFWSGALLGAVMGLWVGVTWGQQLKQAWNTVDRVSSWLFPAVSGSPAPKRPQDGEGGYGSQLYPGAPLQYQTAQQ
mmetsp:Transcript_32386/g.75199  ORF Transcript_32386/g.75199 Transcript_32386/m.75199 type:complete len:111 (-) Transcript_32386:176-508(-)